MSQRDIKTVNSVADAYRSMYAKPIEIDEDVLNEELIDSLIEETREEELLENIQSVIKKYPRDNDWKKLVMKHKRHVDAFKKGKDMPKKVEDEFLSWAMSNNEIQTDDADESDEWLMDTLGESKVEDITEAMSKQMTVQQYASKVGIDAKDKQWIIDNEKDIVVYQDNSKTKGWSALGYPIRNGDYYFAFLGRDNEKDRTAASRANMMMNNYLKSEFAKAKKLKFDDEPYTEDMIASHLWNFMSKEFEKLPKKLGAGDTMTREELYNAIYDITNGGEVQFESFDYQGETIQEGMLSGIVGKIVNKIRSARKKVGKKIKLGKKAKSPEKLHAMAPVAGMIARGAVGMALNNQKTESKYDANVLKSIADTYASMQNYGIQGDVVEDLQEGALEDKAKKSGISVGTLKKVYNRGMAAWKTGHRPGTTPQQWGMARVNAFIVKKKKGGLNHDQDLAHVVHPDDDLMQEVNSVMSVDKKNMPKAKPMIQKLARARGVPVSFDKDGIGVTFKGRPQDVDKLMKDFEKNKTLMKLLEEIQLDEGKGTDVFKKYNKIIGRMSDKEQGEILDALYTMNTQTGRRYKEAWGKVKELLNMEYTPEETQLDEVQKVEVDAMKKVSKDMQKVLKAYQAIANKGDKELKNTQHNFEYKQVLQARDTILSMIGKLQTKMIIQQKMRKEDMMSEASAGAMIDKLFNTGGDKMFQYGVAKLLNMTGVKVALAMQKQNPKGFENTMKAMGKDNKIKLATNNALMKMFKQQGVKPIPEGLEEKVKDGKLDPLSPMGKSKLTGREISNYYKNNPKQKVAARDKSVKKAIELALDLGGNMNYAMKEIEKFKRGLSKNPAVKLALKHANESKDWTGHHIVIENLSPRDKIKLKAYGSQLAKITKLQFDDSNPEKSIDKLMGQIWQQKHSPSNWERLHKMVAMLKSIGVKMPSLKGKYMGLDPVSKKAIFYKEGTDEIVEWHQKIEDIKEEIEELVEKPNKELPVADVKKIAQMTNRNDHNGAILHLAKKVNLKKHQDGMKHIIGLHKSLGHMPQGLIDVRKHISDSVMRVAKEIYTNYDDIYKSF